MSSFAHEPPVVNMTLDFRVGEGEARRRLDELLAVRLIRFSRMYIRSLIDAGACSVNGEAGRAGRRLSAGDEVRFAYDADAPTAMTPEAIELRIIHEDAHLLVVDKPAGMLVHPTRAVHTGTLMNALAHHLNSITANGETPAAVRPGLAHRLDRATSGLLIVSKDAATLVSLARQFNLRRVEKLYLAILDGCVAEDEREINAPIDRDAAAEFPKWRVMSEGKPAATALRVVERKRTRTLVELAPLTGRTNQLRIHTSHIGFPISGDEWYGGSPAARLCLHAARLTFRHPADNSWREFASPLPEEMRIIWDAEPSR